MSKKGKYQPSPKFDILDNLLSEIPCITLDELIESIHGQTRKQVSPRKWRSLKHNVVKMISRYRREDETKIIYFDRVYGGYRMGIQQ